jgi:RNA polymerase sigma-70 factor (ECF subfamily)
LDAVHAGDRPSFDRALEPLRPWLLERARAVLDPRLAMTLEPDDLVQDVLCNVYRSLPGTKVRDRDGLQAWIDRIIRNRHVDLQRRHLLSRKRGHAVSLDAACASSPSSPELSMGDALAGSGTSPSQAAAREEARTRLQWLLAQLPEDQRTVVRLLRMEGRPVREVAQAMQRSEEAVRKLFSRALAECRRLCSPPGPSSQETTP